ncbi:hypothetical protein ACIRPH_30075 [Nocardiopsis sp. NPDC101807]|uniref:hypothetical protein n=1 Tax=Nocardiopsis sp. NPDC101807 TaxID=3364339 RepID=UPI0038221BCD
MPAQQPQPRATAAACIAHARRLAARADRNAARWLDGETSIDLDEVDALASDAIELLKGFRNAFADEVLATRIIADLNEGVAP